MENATATVLNPVADVVDYLMLTGKFGAVLRELSARKVAAATARKSGFAVSEKELQDAADDYRRASRLLNASETIAWLKSTRISPETFEDFIETSVLVDRFKDWLKQKAGEADRGRGRDELYEEWVATAI
jgi:hypothetical protein